LSLCPKPSALNDEHRGVETNEFPGKGETRRPGANDADVGFEFGSISQEARILLQGTTLRYLR
jgi:hypothetical protein